MASVDVRMRMHMRGATGALAALVLLTVTMGLTNGATSAHAADVPDSVLAGRLLPPNPVGPPSYLEFSGQSSDYVAWDVENEEESQPRHLVVRRLSDGSVVRRFDWHRDTTSLQLSGQSAVERSGITIAGAYTTQVTVRDVQTGEVTWTVVLPPTEPFSWAGESWVLSAKSFGDGTAVLRRPGRQPVELPGLNTQNLRRVGGDGTTLVLHVGYAVDVLDLATAEVTRIGTATDPMAQVILTPQRVLWVDSSASGGPIVGWWDRSAHDVGEVTLLPSTGRPSQYLAYGNRLAVAYLDADDTWNSYHVAPIDLVTGERQAPLSDRVIALGGTPDGRAILALSDTDTGRVVAATDDGTGLRDVGAFPVVGQRVADVHLSGNRLAADFGSPSASAAAGLVAVTPVDEAGPWSRTLGGDGLATTIPGTARGAAGDVLLTLTGVSPWGRDIDTVSWAGGHRERGPVWSATLSRGGDVLLVEETTPGAITLERSRSGELLGSTDDTIPVAVDGTVLWRGPDAAGDLVGRDLVTGVSTTIPTSTRPCSSPTFDSLQVAGRFALVRCGERNDVVDLRGVLTTRQVAFTSGRSETDVVLGNGYLAQGRLVIPTSGTPYGVVEVHDLGPGAGTRLYGPVLTTDARHRLAADDGDAARLAYIDTRWQARIVDLDWLTPAPAAITDTVAPTVVAQAGSPRVGGPTITASWTFTDTTGSPGERPSGLASYDVRVSRGPAGATPTTWSEPPELTGLADATTTLSGTAGQDVCWSVRGRDVAGNLSGWSAARCSAVDGIPPTFTSMLGETDIVDGTSGVGFSWSFTDAALAAGVPGSGLSSYDVRYRQAPLRGDPVGPWTSPESWQAQAANWVWLPTRPGGTTCVQVRARDAGGNVSGWSPERCSAVDDAGPTFRTASVGVRALPAKAAGTVTFRLEATDPSGVTGYDVGYRLALPNGSLGPLVLPRAWQATGMGTWSVAVRPGGDACFVGRARDLLGNVSGWTSPRCSAALYDDRLLTLSPGTARVRNIRAANATAIRLARKGQTVILARESGRGLGIALLRGPGQGALDVYAGKKRIGHVSASATSWQRSTLILTTVSFTNARITLRTSSDRPVLVDAVGALR